MGRLTHQTAKIESDLDYRPCVTSLSYSFFIFYLFLFVISLFLGGTGMVAQKEK